VAGASTYAVDFAGDGLLSFAITSGSAASGTLVDNKGTVSAQGGLVLLTAQAAKSVLDNVINTSGIVEATSAANVNGKIVLSAVDGGTAVSGRLDASGKGAGQTGGTVEVLGDNVTLASGAKIDVSGDAGGGTALVGGNFHGAGPQPNAAVTTLAAGSIIDADAITSGNGGTVAVWSDTNTVFDGAITARGGAEGGDGGFVETSGKASLTVTTGSVDTLAPQGAIGTWLLDPTDITVANGVAGAINPSAIDGASSTVTLQAADDITFESPIDIMATGVGLTARAGNSITVAANAAITTNGGTITLSANDPDGPASGSGSIVIASAVSTAGPDDATSLPSAGITLTVNGGSGTISLGSNLLTAGGVIAVDGPTILTGNVAIDTTAEYEADGASIDFAGTIDADAAANARTLALYSRGASIVLGGDIGEQAMLGELSVIAYRSVEVDGSVVTSGTQTYQGTPVAFGGSFYQAGQDFAVNGSATFAALTTHISALDIGLDYVVDGPGALVLNAGPRELVSGYYTGNIELGTVGANTPLASLTATAANAVALDGSVTTVGAQSYTDQTLYLVGTRYQTSGAPFSESGATVLGPRPPLSFVEAEEEEDDCCGGDIFTLAVVSLAVDVVALPDPTIDTTGDGAKPAGAAITFASPGSIDGAEALILNSGTTGAISLGTLGGTTPLGPVTMNAGSIALGGNITTSTGVVTIDAPIVLDANVTIDTMSAAGGADITLADTVDADAAANDRGLTLIAANFSALPGGNVTLPAPVGGAVALGAVSVYGDAVTLGSSVITTGAQFYWGTTVALSGPFYRAGGDFTVSGNATIAPAGTKISALDISFCCELDGPGALALTAGPSEFALGADFDGDYTFAYTGNIVLDTLGATTPLASLTATAANDIELAGSVTTAGPQSYSDKTIYLVGSRYQTAGAKFAESGATVLGAPPVYYSGGSGFISLIPSETPVGTITIVPDPTIDTTGNGADPAGAAITFASPGSIDGAEALTIIAGTKGAIVLGPLGATTPLDTLTISGGEVSDFGTTNGDLLDIGGARLGAVSIEVAKDITPSGGLTITGAGSVTSTGTMTLPGKPLISTAIDAPAMAGALSVIEASQPAAHWVSETPFQPPAPPLLTIIPAPIYGQGSVTDQQGGSGMSGDMLPPRFLDRPRPGAIVR
jgi:trimeric autotransporter adhesin